ncbi:MAG: 4a-hydroxytetrahydrobiopterin dehydratase [Acidimicrobiia bacterium]
MDVSNSHDRDEILSRLVDWSIDGETLHRTFVFGDFTEAMGFVTRVAILAEKANHHPDIDIRWNKVTLALTTHDAGGLTDKDVGLAEKIDRLR